MSNWEAIAKESEDVLATGNIKGCHEILLKTYEGGNHDPQITWRLARSYYEMSQETTDTAVRGPLLRTALELVQQSVQDDPNNFASHKWLGILISAQYVGTKEKIENAYRIRDEFLKAIELNPHDATSLHAMGNWCWSVMQVGWFERKAAALLFATPPSSTYEECLKYLLASAEEGDTIHNAMLTGDVYAKQGKNAEAKKWYEKACGMPALTELQKRQQGEASQKLAAL